MADCVQRKKHKYTQTDADFLQVVQTESVFQLRHTHKYEFGNMDSGQSAQQIFANKEFIHARTHTKKINLTHLMGGTKVLD